MALREALSPDCPGRSGAIAIETVLLFAENRETGDEGADVEDVDFKLNSAKLENLNGIFYLCPTTYSYDDLVTYSYDDRMNRHHQQSS
jgi:hypothetical protein